MVFIRDEGSFFRAPRQAIWRFVGSGEPHSKAHRHRAVSRELSSNVHGRYSWEQEFDGASVRFTMRWTAFVPVGIAYEVLEGPFAGSTFFLFYTPRGRRTGVSVVGEFVSPTLATSAIEPAVRRFFALEFEQDRAAIESHPGRGSSRPHRVRPRARRRSRAARARRGRSPARQSRAGPSDGAGS